ncbi:Cell wall integrity and stress response component 1 [Verticillium dahliae VDG2]|nr:Cell wall integrity and stress response component 1 [Verticillium dahliae VDG2]
MTLLSLTLLGLPLALAQQIGTLVPEVPPALTWSNCTAESCTPVTDALTLDANWRWTHETTSAHTCFLDGDWTDVCWNLNSGTACAERCAVEGADYASTHGITTAGGSASLRYVTHSAFGRNVENRVFLLAPDGRYRMFELLGREVRVDVEVGTLGCGLKGALYFVKMEADGGRGRGKNAAGARYGTGYCDAECSQSIKFVDGRANQEGWAPGYTELELGRGAVGACCAEMGVWQSNSASYVVSAHPCINPDFHTCQDSRCPRGFSDDIFPHGCDTDGCGASPYRLGNTQFYGQGKTLDSGAKFTVITRFHEDHVSQSFIQAGEPIETPPSQASGVQGNAISDDFCDSQASAFGERNRYAEVGGWSSTKRALAGQWVMVMSITHDAYANMLWLDSLYPVDAAGRPGALRGPCPANRGYPAQTLVENPQAKVTFSDIRYGPIGTTG